MLTLRPPRSRDIHPTGEAPHEQEPASAWSFPTSFPGASRHGVGRDGILPWIEESGGRHGLDQKFHGILVTYKDGHRGTVLNAVRDSTHWHFACKLDGDPTLRATSFDVGQWENRCLFKALAHAIQSMFRKHKTPYPVERTLLTTCALDAAMESRSRGQGRVTTPYLNLAYKAVDSRAMRETGESWHVLSRDTPQPKGVDTTTRDG
jgi:hypothetical protein